MGVMKFSVMMRSYCLHPDKYQAQASKDGFLRTFQHAGLSLQMRPEITENTQMAGTFQRQQQASRRHYKQMLVTSAGEMLLPCCADFILTILYEFTP